MMLEEGRLPSDFGEIKTIDELIELTTTEGGFVILTNTSMFFGNFEDMRESLENKKE